MTPEILLHALTGIRSPRFRTIHIGVTLGSIRLEALLDSGSTHNFINEGMARHLGLKIRQQHGMFITVGNGDRINCPGLYPDLPLLIGSEDFMVYCYAMPLDGHNIILGVQFLSTLGLTLWDFAEQTLCFCAGTGTSCGQAWTMQPGHNSTIWHLLLIATWICSWRSIRGFSGSLLGCRLAGISVIASDFMPELRQSLFGPIGMLTPRRMSWRANVRSCCAMGSSDRARRCFHLQHCWSRSRTDHDGCASTIMPLTLSR
jgi:hypothetical protein